MGAAVALVSWSLIGLAPGVVGDTLFEISKSLPLAARRAHGIVAPAVVRTGLTVAALPAAFAFGGLARLAVVGLALSAGDLGGAWHLHVRALDLGGVEEPGRWRRPRLAGLGVGRAVVAALAFAAAAFAGRRLVESFAIGGRALRSVASLTIGGLLGAVACAAYYWWVGSPVLPGWTGRTRGRRDRSARTAAIPAIGAVAIVAGVAIAAALARVGPALVVAGALTIVLLAVTARRPASAAWIYLGAMPLLAGIDRGRFVPLLRPTEVLQIVVTAGVVVGALGRRRGRPWPALRITRLDTALGALVLAGSVAPLARLLLAGTRPTGADLLACVPLWKYAALYVLFRATIRSRADVRRACAVSLAAAVAVSVIAVLQTLDLAGVPRLLATFWAPRGDAGDLTEGRGTATFAGAIATSVYLTFNLALALALALRSRGRVRWFNSIAGAALLCGVIGTAQFSGLAGVAIVVAVVSVSSGRVRQLAKGALVAAPVAALIAAPALVARFGELGTNGLPVSWAVRLYNLQTYYWPQLAGRGWLLGTRPNTIVAAPERWRDVIYVESGHTWLLLAGGVPLLVDFVAFTVIAAWSLREAARLDDDAWSPMARAALAAVTAVFVLMVLDTHLTMRGSADMLFALTGMALGRYGSRALPWPLPRWHGGNARHLAVTP